MPCLSSVSTSTENAEVWIFCLSSRLHSVGWASKQSMWTYMPPKKLRSLCNEEWSDFALRIQNETSSHAPITFQRELPTHYFVVGTRVSVSEQTNLRAATVVDVVDNHRFNVLFDPPFQEGTFIFMDFHGFSWKLIEDSSLSPVVDTSCPLFETAATTRKNFVTDSSTAAEGIEKCCPARCHDEPFAVSVPFQPAVFYWNILWIFPCSSAHLRSGFELYPRRWFH